MQQYYNYPRSSAVGLSRALRRQRLGESLGIARGTIQPWNLPEYRPMAEALRTGTERTLRSLPEILARSGVSGPAAGLTMERIAQGGQNSLLNLVNQLRQGTTQQGLNLAGTEESAYQGLAGLDLSKYGLDIEKEKLDEQRKRNAWNRIMSVLQTVGSVGAGILSGGATVPLSLASILASSEFGGSGGGPSYSLGDYASRLRY